MNQSLKEGQNPSLRGLCEERENSGLATIGEALGNLVRGLIRIQYPSRVNGNGYGRCLKARTAHGGDS